MVSPLSNNAARSLRRVPEPVEDDRAWEARPHRQPKPVATRAALIAAGIVVEGALVDPGGPTPQTWRDDPTLRLRGDEDYLGPGLFSRQRQTWR